MRALKHRLADETRRLVDNVALLDIRGFDEGELRRLTERGAGVADHLEGLPRFAEGMANAPGDDGMLSERSGISGRGNPLAPPLDVEFDGDITRASAVYGLAYEGPPGHLHGGFVAAAFDDLLGLAQIASGQAGYTGTLA